MIFDVVRTTLNTSTGTQDITGDLGGNQPVAAFFTLIGSTSEGVVADGATIGMGATDGATQFSASVTSRHNISTSDNYRSQRSDSCVYGLSKSSKASDIEAAFSSWITNGVRINITNAPTSAYFLVVKFFYGNDVSAKAGNFQLPTIVDTAIAITDVGFLSKIIFFYTSNTHELNTLYDESTFSFGGATATDQIGITTRGKFGATTTSTTHYLPTDRVGAETDTNLDYGIEISDIDSSGFDATPRNGAPSQGDFIGYLALDFDGDVDARVITMPTSTGSNAFTVGLNPMGIILSGAGHKSTNTVLNTNGFFGLYCADSDEEYSVNYSDADGVTTTDTQSVSDNTLESYNGSGSLLFSGTFDGFAATSYSIDFTVAAATARYWLSFAFSPPPSVSVQAVTSNLAIAGESVFAAPASEVTVVLATSDILIASYSPIASRSKLIVLLTGSIAVVGYEIGIGVAEGVVKPNSSTLSIVSEKILLSASIWTYKQDDPTANWINLTDECRS